MWVLDYLEDIDSDMSAFHRVDDARSSMPVGLYFERAERLPAYDGVMRVRARQYEQRGGTVGPQVDAATMADGDWLEYDNGGAAT